MSHTIVLTISDLSDEQREILMALLADVGYEGFEESDNELLACISEVLFDEASTKEIVSNYSSEYTIEKVAPRNWNADWEQQYRPVFIDDFAAIRAHFHEPIKSVQHEIVITPKMSFGTGHHATTRQMMLAMKEIDFSGKTVFDYGTGTGVLSILASLLGAGQIVAMDIDDWCIENTNENLERNQIDNVIVLKGEQPPKGEQYDIVLANINRHILLEQMRNMSDALPSEGILLMSGFYEEDIPMLEESANNYQLNKLAYSVQDNWVCLMMRKS
ncbi:MAG: 50S ribosomal protein L11 methyltransferase [Bacteroidetes bacterium]|nr:50S ribosomal protein L11 methyltransferase [Bacteroidota bacterium]